MSEKVKVTAKTAEIIKNSVNKYPKHEIVRNYDSIRFSYREEMDLDTLIRALYIGYEVETEYKEGDWVVNNISGDIGIAKEITEKGIYTHNGMGGAKGYFRLATPEEIAQEKKRKFWAKIGRDVDEYRNGDMFFEKPDKSMAFVVQFVKGDEIEDVDGNYYKIKGIELVTPVEKRLDK